MDDSADMSIEEPKEENGIFGGASLFKEPSVIKSKRDLPQDNGWSIPAEEEK